ncbi:MAG: alanine--tRNA ligase, partial [Deltaproteobacteria bacterium]|nr:alanine--tRNA ligase [Deltaproteobacteria bacterium]
TAKALRSTPTNAAGRAAALLEKERKLSREVEQLKQKLATAGAGKDPADEAREVGGIKVLATRVEGIQLSGLRDFADGLRDKLGGGVVLAAAVEDGKMSAVCSVTKSISGKAKAGDLLKAFFQITGGRGGGRPDFAQGGGGDPAKLDEGLDAFYPMVEKALAGQ